VAHAEALGGWQAWNLSGVLHYRSSACCRMRWNSDPFCRVCKSLLTNTIRVAAGQLPVGPVPNP
jgi:hypothetical protein